MAIHVALHHRTHYRYDRPVTHAPHVIRLRPVPHCRTPVLSYSLKVQPAEHFLNWQQDPFSNYHARAVFPEKTTELLVEVDLVAEQSAGRVVGIEVKASAAPRIEDARHLIWLRDRLGDRFVAGVVLHTGPRVYRLGERILAVPICALWDRG